MEPQKMENDMLYINTKFLQRLRQASRWFVFLLLACLAGGVAQAQTLSFTPGLVTNLTSTSSTTGSAANYTGPLSALVVNEPQGLTYDSQGDLFIVDAGANVVRVVASGKGPIPSLPSVSSPVAGTVYTVAGSGNSTPSTTALCSADEQYTDSNYYGNGCSASNAILNFLVPQNTGTGTGQSAAPSGQVALDAGGNLYIADAGDYQVRVVYAGGTVPGLQASLPNGVTPIVGNIYTFSGTPNISPVGVTVDASGDVYILFYQSNAYSRYHMANIGVIYNGGTLPLLLSGQTSLTTGQYANLFPANYANTAPPWHQPTAIALDSSGNIYISETSGNILGSVYVIYAEGTVSGLAEILNGAPPVQGYVYTIAGNKTKRPHADVLPAYPPGVAATAVSTIRPTQISFDSAGNLYVGLIEHWEGSDAYVAKVDTSGNLALVAGNRNLASNNLQVVCSTAADSFGDGCPANQVAIWGPFGLAVAPDGSIDYADLYQDPNTSDIYYALHKIDVSTSVEQFPTASAGVASAAQVVAISNADAKPLNISGLTFPNDFTQVASGGTDCTASTTLTAGQSCLVGIQFQAAQDGTYSDNVTITSDSTNADAGVNSIAVSGTATAATGTTAQTITFTAPSTATHGQTVTLNGTASSGLTVLYRVSGPGRIQGSTLTVTGVGAITVTAYQPGDNGDSGNSAGWSAATPVSGTITAQPATLTVTADSFDQTPGLAIPTLTYKITGFVNGDTQATATTGAPDISTTATDTSAPGTYPITITQGTLATTTKNYSLTFVNGTFTIDSRLTQTITFTQSLSNVIYGASPITLTATASSGLAVTYTVTGPATITGSFLTITGAGAVGVTATQFGNVTYMAAQSVTQSFLVQPATLTFTANNLTMAAGSPVPTLTYTVGGLVPGDTAAKVVNNTPLLATTATSSSPVNTYPITIAQGLATLSTNNYTLTSASFVNGTMNVVTGSPQTITFNTLPNVTYGVTPLALSATSDSGLSVTLTVSSGPASITNNVLSVTGAGTVTVTATQAGNATYSPAKSVSQSMTVAQAQLTMTADNKTRVDNTWNPTLTYTTTGFVNGDTAAVLNGGPSISTTATASSPAGNYPITLASVTYENGNTTPSATNYTMSYVPGTFTITSGGPTPNFTMALSTQSLTILSGALGQVTLTIAPTNYYQGVLNLSCTGLPANASCVFTPAALNVTLTYDKASDVTPIPTKGTLTITTSSASVVGSLRQSGSGIYSASIAGWASLLFGGILAWQRKRLARHKTIWVLALAACLCGMAASLTACGSSNSFSLTQSGSSTIQVVATDSNGGPVNSIPLAVTIK
jgi:hypothetical protein